MSLCFEKSFQRAPPAARSHAARSSDIRSSPRSARLLEARRIVHRRGDVVLAGVPWRRPADLSAHDLLGAIFFGLATLRSGREWDLPVHGRGLVWEEPPQGHDTSRHGIFGGFETVPAEGRIPLEGLVHRTTATDPAALYARILCRGIAEPCIVLDRAARALSGRSRASAG